MSDRPFHVRMRLTKAGKRFLERYKKFRGGLDDAAKRQFDRAFGA